MTIYDRARDALHELDPDGQNAPPWKAVGWQEHGEFDLDTIAYRHGPLPREVAELAALAPELAAAVVRVAALADWLDGKAEQWKAEGDDASAFDGHEVAARIREVIERDKENEE